MHAIWISDWIAAGHEDEELLTAVAPDGIVSSQPRLKAFRGPGESHVPREMPIGVIDLLEVIEISHDNAQHMAVAASALDLTLKQFENRFVIPETCQRVVRCLLAELFLGDRQGRFLFDELMRSFGDQPFKLQAAALRSTRTDLNDAPCEKRGTKEPQ